MMRAHDRRAAFAELTTAGLVYMAAIAEYAKLVSQPAQEVRPSELLEVRETWDGRLRDLGLLPPDGSDKLVHMAAFAGLAALVAITWQLAAGQLNRRHLIAVWLAVALYAALDEWTQPLFGRDASLGDWTADVVGALIALILFASLRQRFSSRRPSNSASAPDTRPT